MRERFRLTLIPRLWFRSEFPLEWVKLSTRFYLDPAVASLPDADTELMFVRALAYAGAEDTGGFIPEAIVPSLIRRRRYGAAVEALVATSLWVPSSGDRGQPGYRIARWQAWQEELEALERRRASDRERSQRQRDRKRAEAEEDGQPARKRGRPAKQQTVNTSRDASALNHVIPHTTDVDRSDLSIGGVGQSKSDAHAGGNRDDEAELIAIVAAKAAKAAGRVVSDDEARHAIEVIRKRAVDAGQVIDRPRKYFAVSVEREADIGALLRPPEPSLREILSDPEPTHPDQHPFDFETRTSMGVDMCACGLPDGNARHVQPQARSA